MQRLFQPEQIVWRDRQCELDAPSDIVGRVHVQHEQHIGADRLADRADAGDFITQRQCAALQLDGTISIRNKAREFIGCGPEWLSFQ